jgi:transcriptional regulator with GAF, ATPase, and Fis domain
MARSAETVVRLMVAKDPRQSADTILEFLMGMNGCAAGAVFAVEEGLPLFVSRGIAQDALDWTRECWQRERNTLCDGKVFRAGRRLLLPVPREARLAALVYLEAEQIDLASLSEVSALVADAVARGAHGEEGSSPVESYLEHTTRDEIERRKLLILLDRHEWNVARVARELRLTRTTVYKRLAAFGIERKKVPKAVRVARASSAP